MTPETMKALTEAMLEAEALCKKFGWVDGRFKEALRLLSADEASQQECRPSPSPEVERLVEAVEKIAKAELWSHGHHVRLDATTIQEVTVFAAAALAAYKEAQR